MAHLHSSRPKLVTVQLTRLNVDSLLYRGKIAEFPSKGILLAGLTAKVAESVK